MRNVTKLQKEIAQEAIDRMNDFEGTNIEELHQNLFNNDYYIIGTWSAKQWLIKYDVFECMEMIREYEQDNFGEVNTDLSNPEAIVNMVVYIVGEEVLSCISMDEGILTDRKITKMKSKIAKEYGLTDNNDNLNYAI